MATYEGAAGIAKLKEKIKQKSKLLVGESAEKIAIHLIDNSVIGGQYWGNGVNALPCDIVVDMGKVYTLSSYGFDRLLEVNVWDSSRSISAHDVFTSLDNAAWTLQVSATAPPLAPGAWLNNFPSPVAARYVILRIYSNHSSDGQKWVDFHELKFR